jgi:colanic acid/amylovoran biosynthesis glycosyltransferase
MRIAYFTGSYPRATDTFIQREVAGLRRKGIDVRTFSVRRTSADHDVGPEIVREKHNTAHLIPVGLGRLVATNIFLLLRAPKRYLSALQLALRTARPGLKGLVYQLFYFQEAVILGAALRRANVSHIHNHFGDSSGTITLLAGRLTGVSYSITVHGPHIFFDPTHWALREKVANSAFIVCISRYCQSQMMLFSDRSDWTRLKIVHCGVDIARFSCQAVRDTARNLLYAGRLAAEKGLPVLFEGLRMLSERGYDFQLTLVGDGADRASLEELARKLGIAERLKFTGYVNQEGVREYLQRSDIFILPSFAEGVPVSLMEAMASGVPVVATHVGGVAELVEQEKTGLIVPPADSLALCEAVARYLDDPHLRRQVAQRGREMVAKHFNFDMELDKLAGLFAGLGHG